MHKIVYNKFNSILKSSGHKPRAVLEIGTPKELNESLLFLPSIPDYAKRYGIDQEGPYKVGSVFVINADANKLPFRKKSFDLVLCNSVLEHDPKFWLTIMEMKRVLKKGGLLIIGVPGFSEDPKYYIETASTITLNYHRFPDDYYRFSVAAMTQVFFNGLINTQHCTIMRPPRIIGWGWKK